jgi:hypothetical protein
MGSGEKEGGLPYSAVGTWQAAQRTGYPESEDRSSVLLSSTIDG